MKGKNLKRKDNAVESTEKIVKRINATISTSGCNLRCEYCYLAQVKHKNHENTKALRYSLETIFKACSKQRLGGTCIIQLIGDGETLLPSDVIPLIRGLLKEGHYVVVINNGTMTARIHELIECTELDETIDHLMFTFSLHFLELEKRKLLDIFEDNINYVKMKKVSFDISLVCSDDYIAAADRIHGFCNQNLGGVVPSVLPADQYDTGGNHIGMLSSYNQEIYYRNIKRAFPSFDIKYREDIENTDNHQFCYAGSWCFYVDFTTGRYSQCLRNEGPEHNFFEHLDEKLMAEPVGNRCRAPYCICGWTKTLNLIPGASKYEGVKKYINEPKYKYMSEKMLRACYSNFAETNKEYTEEQKNIYHEKQIREEYFARKIELLKFDYAEKKYDRFIEAAEILLEQDLNPRLINVVWLIVRYGYALLLVGQIDKALDLASCYEDMRYSADYCYVMGLIYVNKGMIDNAVTMFTEATERTFVIDKGANAEWAYFNLGLIAQSTGNRKRAKEYYLKCGNYEPAKQQLVEITNQVVSDLYR